MLQFITSFIFSNYIILLFVLSIVVFYQMVKIRSGAKTYYIPASVAERLALLSFLTVFVSSLFVILNLEILGQISLSELLNFVIFFS